MSETGTALATVQPARGVRRRALLRAVCAGAAVFCASAFPVRRAAGIVLPAITSSRRFSVLYKGARIGAHTIGYSPATGEIRVSTEIHLLVKVAFFTAFAFDHRSEETWRDGRLASLDSETLEHGETLHVHGVATPDGFRVQSKSGPAIVSAQTLTSNSLWTPAVLEQKTLVDAQHGGVIGVSARRLADEQIVVGASQVPVTRYTFITPYLAGNIWYDAQDLWVRGEFERDGAKIQYQLDA